ncbi:hypothetical protein NNL50_00980, partial [Enterococcus faecium]|nr:hypothetical protein [Enterococcus faecium]
VKGLLHGLLSFTQLYGLYQLIDFIFISLIFIGIFKSYTKNKIIKKINIELIIVIYIYNK